MLKVDPSKRAKAEKILDDPWFEGVGNIAYKS